MDLARRFGQTPPQVIVSFSYPGRCRNDGIISSSYRPIPDPAPSPTRLTSRRRRATRLFTELVAGCAEDPCWDSEFEGDDAGQGEDYDAVHGPILSHDGWQATFRLSGCAAVWWCAAQMCGSARYGQTVRGDGRATWELASERAGGLETAGVGRWLGSACAKE